MKGGYGSGMQQEVCSRRGVAKREEEEGRKQKEKEERTRTVVEPSSERFETKIMFMKSPPYQ